jgi:hypothetical protein
MSQTFWDVLLEKAKEFADEFAVFVESADEWEEWNSVRDVKRNWAGFMRITYLGLSVVKYTLDEFSEVLDDLTEEEKIELTAKLIDEKLEFNNWLLEMVDGWLIKLALKSAVDALQRKHGCAIWDCSTEIYAKALENRDPNVLFA